MSRLIDDLRFLYRPQLLAMRDFGHRITGNDKWIEEYDMISCSLLYYSDYAERVEHNMDKSKTLREAHNKWAEWCDYKDAYGYVLSSYNQYRSRRAENKKKVEEGRKLLRKFNLTMIKSKEELRKLDSQLHR